MLSNEDCQACIETLGAADGLNSNRMYACYSICQDPKNFITPTIASSEPGTCVACISTLTLDVNSCKQW